ncbi:redoxin domain-containing protein [Clostridiaceae bacterium 35-E11]
MKKQINMLMITLLCITLLSGCFWKEEAPQNEEDENKVKLEDQGEPSNNKNENILLKEEKNENEEPEETGVFVGDKAYDFTLLDREGNEIKLSDLKGKVVFLNFWATWCSTCTTTMTDIQEVYEQYQNKDVVILAVNVLTSEKIDITEVNKFVDEKGYTFPVFFDVDGVVSVEYKVRAFPSTYIINKDGEIGDFISGPMHKETMVEKIESVRDK